MRPSHHEPHGSVYNARDQRTFAPQDLPSTTSTRRRTHNEDSWIEISSHPSTSSLVSTTNDLHNRLPGSRQPRPLRPTRSLTEPPRSTSATGSSQDEYEESSSESDRVLSSSNEDISRADDGDEDDDNRTALGVRTNEPFTPQPNAFSHPPTARNVPGSYFPNVASAPSSHMRSDRPSRSRPYLQRERERAMTNSLQPDHDAALRASLTTLLSCAAAVRPKTDDKGPERPILTRPNAQPTIMRLVPESALDAPRPAKPAKRRSRESSKERNAKKIRTNTKPPMVSSYDDYISPTLASWFISAGVVLVFSAISFSAGYAWGKEVGRIEGELGLTGSTCGKEAIQGGSSGLRRLHWGNASSTVRA